MSEKMEKLLSCYRSVREKTDFEPKVAVILGSGLGAFADEIAVSATVDYSEIEGMPVSTVPAHRGRFVFGKVGNVPVVVMQGRVHYYEGYDLSDVVLPTRLMYMMGARSLVLTNAAGGVNPEFNAGDLMMIKDHIMTFFPNPLLGENLDSLGPRFPDMSKVYDPEYCDIIRAAAEKKGIDIKEGVYTQLTGPSFETPTEVRMLHVLGADAVGMSTACEAVVANHMGMRICGISCISNKGAGLSDTPLTHEEVQETADRVAPVFRSLLWDTIEGIGRAEGIE